MATTMNVQRTAVTSTRVAGAKDVPLRHFAAAGSSQAPVCSSVSSRAHGLGHTPVRQTQIRQLGQLQRSSATEYIGNVVAQPEWRFAVVVARFNSLVTKELLEGAIEVFNRHGVPAANVDVAWVPGSFELPVVAKAMAASGSYEAVLTIGAIIKGATSHYDAVVAAATSGVLSAGTATGVPVVFGVLTTEDLEQALDRAGGKVGNKGGEAAETAIEMASLMAQLRGLGKAAPAKLE